MDERRQAINDPGTTLINAPEQSGIPFNRPTHFTVASNGDLYASDGYGNSHIHCFDSKGNLKFSWGGHGSGPGEFDTIHSVYVDIDDNDKIYATDRYNNRIQYFSIQVNFLENGPTYICQMTYEKGQMAISM